MRLLLCSLLLLCTAVLADEKIDLQGGSYGPFRLGMSVADATKAARQLLTNVKIHPTGVLCEISALSKDRTWSVNMMFENDKAYDLMLGGPFPGRSAEGITSKSTVADYTKALGPPSKTKVDKDFGVTTYTWLKPNLRVTWEGSRLVSLRFVPAGKSSVWD